MKQKLIDYNTVRKYWDSSFAGNFNYREGYKIDDENFALLRFKIEVKAIKKILKKNFKNTPSKTCSSSSFLDVGCGNGKFSFYFSNYFKEVVGIDFSKKSIDIAKKEALRRKIKNTAFYCADLKKLKLKQEFDIIFVGGVLMYIDDQDLLLVLTKLKKHLAADGLLILREPFFKEKTLLKKGDYPVIYRSLKGFIKKLKKEKFKIINLKLNEGYNYGIITDFYLRFLPKRIVFGLLAKPKFLKLNHLILKRFIQCKGYFIAVKK
ncbi:MAG: class I SAM-dependent methyltransferase [Nanoarchaeota archaeon]